MLESVANVLSRIQQIQERFGEMGGIASQGDEPSFEDTLNKAMLQERKNSPSEFTGLIDTYSQKYGLNPNLVTSIIKAESNFNPDAVSKKGAAGLMQLMPGTAKELGVTNIFNPEENIEGGTKYFRTLLDNFNQNLPLALAAYNAGPETVKKTNGIPPIAETKNYVEKVLKFYEEANYTLKANKL
ncbi:MAG: lytic transglycosylase domain-containing protein [bacterium]|nr:lytic transglycosylase domain-containing protein [bacterium]